MPCCGEAIGGVDGCERPCRVAATLTPCPLLQVAIIAGNFELAEYIKNHKETDIGEWARGRRAPSGGRTLPASSHPHETGPGPVFNRTSRKRGPSRVSIFVLMCP